MSEIAKWILFVDIQILVVLVMIIIIRFLKED